MGYTTITMMKFCVLSLVVLAIATPAFSRRTPRSVEEVLAAHPEEVAQAQAALDEKHAKKKDAATAAADAHPEAVEKANAAAAQKQANHQQAAAAFAAAYPEEAAQLSAAAAQAEAQLQAHMA